MKAEMSNRALRERTRLEEERIQRAYARRSEREQRYSWFDRGHLLIAQQVELALVSLLQRIGMAPLDGKRILEVGCGSGHWLREFVKWGARPENLVGVELMEERAARARKLCPAAVRIDHASATELSFPDRYFDIVLQATVFTSIFDADIRRRIAAEMARVTARNGVILWYDFHVDNPWNPDVRGIKKGEIEALFPDCAVELRRITLAPPLARRLAPYSWTACCLLEQIPWLCTHYLGAIRPRRLSAEPLTLPVKNRHWSRQLQLHVA